jgi:hypothetical protein
MSFNRHFLCANVLQLALTLPRAGTAAEGSLQAIQMQLAAKEDKRVTSRGDHALGEGGGGGGRFGRVEGSAEGEERGAEQGEAAGGAEGDKKSFRKVDEVCAQGF